MFERLRVKAPSMETIIVNLSGGNQQKVVLGKWLLAKPEILFVDEPTKGIDVGAKAEIYKLMNELAQKWNVNRDGLVGYAGTSIYE